MAVQCKNCNHTFTPSPGDGGDLRCPTCGVSMTYADMLETIAIDQESPLATKPSVEGIDGSTIVTDFVPTTQVAHFQLIRPLGSGAFGIVWNAYDQKLDRSVALKIPHIHMLEGKTKERFLAEAKSAARLNHPGIVSVYEVGLQEGQPYIATELLEGQTLARMIDESKPSFETSARIVLDIAEALDYAHSMGVVHRDVKPENIFIDHDGKPHIMDFGLAKSTATATNLTTDGSLLGTPAYMAPEQASGKAHEVDGRADLYSTGVVLYQLLTGELPFRGTFQSVLQQTLTTEAPPPRTLNPKIPRDLESICLKCLQKKPKHRFDSCRELAEELKRYLRGEPVLTRPISRVARVWRWCTRYPAIASLSAAVCLLVLFVAVAGPIVAIRQTVLATAERMAKEEAETLRSEAQRLLYFSDMRVADHAWRGGNANFCRQLLQRHLPKDDQVDLRGFEWRYLWQLCHADMQTFEHGFQVNQLRWSQDGTQFLSVARDRSAKRWTIGESSPVAASALLKPDDRLPDVNQIAVRPGLQHVAFARDDGGVEIWDCASSEPVLELQTDEDRVSCVAFSEDGGRLAAGSDDGTVWVWSLDSSPALSAKLSSQVAFGPLVMSVAFTPDEKLVIAGEDGKVGVWDLRENKIVELPPQESKIHLLAVSPDGTMTATANLDATAKVFDLRSKQEVATLRGHTAWIWGVGFSPDGKLLATGGADNTVRVWDIREGKERFSLQGHSGTVFAVQFAPDGQSLLSANVDGTVKQWSLKAPKPNMLAGHPKPIESLCFLSENRLLSGSRDGQVLLWDTDAGQATLIAQMPKGVLSIAPSSDGEWVALGCENGDVAVWDVETRQEKWRKPHAGAKDKVYSVAFGPNNLLASAGTDPNIKFWDAETGELQGSLPAEHHGEVIERVLFTPDGKLISAARDRRVRLWDSYTNTMLAEFESHGDWVLALGVTPDSQTILSAGYDRTLREWNRGTGESQALDGHSNWIWDLAVSPDGKNAATASVDSTVRIWDLTDHSERFTLHGHDNAVLAVAYSPSGNIIASAGDGGEIRLWRSTPASP